MTEGLEDEVSSLGSTLAEHVIPQNVTSGGNNTSKKTAEEELLPQSASRGKTVVPDSIFLPIYGFLFNFYDRRQSSRMRQ